MRRLAFRSHGLLVFAFGAVALVASGSAMAQEHATERVAERELGEPYTERPLVTPPRSFEGVFGLAYGQNGYAGSLGQGGAFNADANVGIVRGLDLGAGFGVRFGTGAINAGAERFVRVNDEWIPFDHIVAGDANLEGIHTVDRADGEEIVTNPDFRLRYAPLNTGAFMLGFEFFTNLPFFANSCWTPGAGVPIHVRFGGRFRIETGFFHEFLVCPGTNAYADTFMNIPFRFNIQIVDRVWLGVRSGLELWNYSFDTNHWFIPLGFQGGVRIVRQLDLMFDFVAPEFIHQRCTSADCRDWSIPAFQFWGFGVSALVRIPG